LAFTDAPRLDEPPALFRFILERARELLGKDSPEFVAMVLRVTPPVGSSIREMCREHYGWRRSRSELYRRSNNGAVRVAVALAADGVAPPAGLLAVHKPAGANRERSL
jgi:hypothetical protein